MGLSGLAKFIDEVTGRVASSWWAMSTKLPGYGCSLFPSNNCAAHVHCPHSIKIRRAIAIATHVRANVFAASPAGRSAKMR